MSIVIIVITVLLLLRLHLFLLYCCCSVVVVLFFAERKRSTPRRDTFSCSDMVIFGREDSLSTLTFHFLLTRFFAKKNRRLLKAPDGITFAHQQRTMMVNALSSSSSSSLVFSQTLAEWQARRKWWWWFLVFARFFTTQKRNFDFDHQVTPYVSTIAPHEVFPSVALILREATRAF